MTREIKFRAWDKDMREMVQVSGIQLDAHSPKEKPCIIDEHNDIRDMDEIELMQFTGLKDRHGKEIYEGDIVKINIPDLEGGLEESVSQVEYSGSGFVIDETYPLDAFVTNSEIIGNIYEHKHLLES